MNECVDLVLEASRLRDENADLRAEIELLRAQLVSDINAETEIDRLETEIERLLAALRGATDMIEMLGVPLSHSGQAELDGYRRALEGK